jgi:hypothetical protein
MKKTTIVTSLYDIGRNKIDGRTWDQYLEWFSETLKIKSPMVIFVDESLEDFVKSKRGGLETEIIVQPLTEIPYYHLKDKIDDIISGGGYRKIVKDPDRIECTSSLYTIVQFSKFGWVEEAAKKNFFNSENFLWLDAGISRFFSRNGVSTDLPIPSKTFLNNSIDLEGKIMIQTFISYYPDLALAEKLDESYLLDNRSFVAGGIFMVSSNSIGGIKKEIDVILHEKMIDKGLINNEQIVLGYLSKKNPDLFQTFQNYHNIHRDYEILNFLQQ